MKSSETGKLQYPRKAKRRNTKKQGIKTHQGDLISNFFTKNEQKNDAIYF
jgi:hypothetical protein